MSTELFIPSVAPEDAISGQSKLLIVEPDKEHVITPRRHIVRPVADWPPEADVSVTTTLGHSKSQLVVREWDFYTAMTKTELAYSLPGDDARSRSYGAYLQHRAILRWHPQNLRLTETGVFSRKDSARTSLANRFGEALMYLYMVHAGYPFWDHLPSLAERLMETYEYSRDDKLRIAKIVSRPTRPDGKRVREPDFVFEHRNKQVALAEAKGAFVNPQEAPSMVKGDLSGGLKQIESWRQHISPSPHRSFAIGAYLREENDTYPDPSLLAVVDPEGNDEGARALEFPSDWIRRGNYAAWMRGMRLGTSARLLAYGRSAELPSRFLAVVDVAGRSFAVIPVEFQLRIEASSKAPPLDFYLFDSLFLGRVDLHVIGIEVRNLRLIEKVVNSAGTSFPAEMTIDTVAPGRAPEWFSGSIMPDGTLNAILHLDRGPIPLTTQDFRL